MSLGKATIPIRAALDRLKGDLDKAKKQFGDAAKQITKNMENVGKIAFAGLLTGITAAGTALAGLGVLAVGVSSDISNATKTLQAAFGYTEKEAIALTNVAKEVWRQGFYESIEDAAKAVGNIRQQLGDLSDEELTRAAIKADQFFGVYETESTATISAVNTLMKNFGLTSDQAFDFLASGFQKGLNRAGDFVESIEEYSTQFSNGGASAEQFFSIMETGLQGGMLGTDKAADAFKEFRVRILDGSTATGDALKMLGINADEFTQSIANGEITTAEAFDTIIGKLGEVEDESILMQAGVGLIGTQFEDMGTEAALALSMASTSLKDMAGASDAVAIKYEDWPTMFESVKRSALLSLAPIGNLILQIAREVLPKIIEKFKEFEDKVKPALETIERVVKSFIGNLKSGKTPIDSFVLAISGIAPPKVVDAIENIVYNVLPDLKQRFTELVDSVNEFIAPIKDLVTEFVSLEDILLAVSIAIGVALVAAVGSFMLSIAPIVLTLAALIGVVALLRNIWENDFLGIKTALIDFWENTGKPIFETISAWFSENLPKALEFLTSLWETVWPVLSAVLGVFWNIIKKYFENWASFINDILVPVILFLYDQWVNVVWPAIQAALQRAWEYIQPILKNVVEYVRDTLIPQIIELWNNWRDRWEEIKVALQNVWTIVSNIFKEIVRWIKVNIIPWVKELVRRWKEDFNVMVEAGKKLWKWLEPFFNDIKSYFEKKIPEWLEALKTKWDEIWDGLSQKIEPAKEAVDRITEAIKTFWEWLTSKTFEFDFKLPDLPDWALPGSPLPLHTAWKNFGNYMDTLTIEPKAELSDIEPLANMLNLEEGEGNRSVSYSSNTTINTNQDPFKMLRASRYLDKLGTI